MTDNTLRDQARRDDVDPRSADVGVLIYGVCELAERVQTASENGTLPDSFEQRHADQIEAAAETAIRVVKDADGDEFWEDVTALDDELLVAVREDLAPFASVFGVDLDQTGYAPIRPTPAVEDYLTLDVDQLRRGA